jgi:hypothetical protein
LLPFILLLSFLSILVIIIKEDMSSHEPDEKVSPRDDEQMNSPEDATGSGGSGDFGSQGAEIDEMSDQNLDDLDLEDGEMEPVSAAADVDAVEPGYRVKEVGWTGEQQYESSEEERTWSQPVDVMQTY